MNGDRLFNAVRLGQVTSLISSGSTPLGGESVYLKSGPVMLLRSQNVRMNRLDIDDVAFISDEINGRMRRSVLRYHDVLLNITGASIGRVAVFDIPNTRANVNQHVCIIRPLADKLDSRFLTYFLSSPTVQHEINNRHQHGGTRQALTFNQIAEFEIPLPSLSEQKRIADILDKADDIYHKRWEMLETTEALVRSIFLQTFGDPINNPKRWPLIPLGDAVAKLTDGEHLNPAVVDTGMPIVTAANVLHDGVNFDDVKYVTIEDGTRFRSKCGPVKNDLLMVSRGATIGRCSVVDTDIPFCLMGSVILVKPNKTIATTTYLKWLFSHHGYYNRLFKTSGSSAQQAIYLTHLRDLHIPAPPIHLQNVFASNVDQIQQVRCQSEYATTESRELFNSLVQRAFRGEL